MTHYTLPLTGILHILKTTELQRWRTTDHSCQWLGAEKKYTTKTWYEGFRGDEFVLCPHCCCVFKFIEMYTQSQFFSILTFKNINKKDTTNT